MTVHDLARPYGRRTCVRRGTEHSGDGGDWLTPWDSVRGNVWVGELPDTIGKFQNLARAMLVHEIESKLSRGSRGMLSYGHGEDHDVEKMQCTYHVLELRLRAQLDGQGKRLHTRIYFSEPAAELGVMKLLFMATKTPDDFGRREQNRHAKFAQTRLDTCRFMRDHDDT